MHLHSDEEIDKLSEQEVKQLLKVTIPNECTENQLKELLKKNERTRTIGGMIILPYWAKATS